MAPQRMAVNISITPELDSFLQKRVSEPSRARSATLRLLETSRAGTRWCLATAQSAAKQNGPHGMPINWAFQNRSYAVI